MKIPWLSKARISKTASALMADYDSRMGFSVTPPIPVEDIIERHLRLTLSFDDLEEKLGMPDVLGATYVRSRRIVVNERLLEERYEGRLVLSGTKAGWYLPSPTRWATGSCTGPMPRRPPGEAGRRR
ncbi:MAG: hypothetical protein JRK53_08120 [Deltaproteobacteria bacterium]|nr:hypothetical protein [Deltaproteobacteria bacterium]